MMDWGGGGMWGGDWITLLFSIAFLAAVIVGIVLVVRALTVSETGGNQTSGDRPDGGRPVLARETPEDLVRRRYAAGEIDRGEYQQKLRDLSG